MTKIGIVIPTYNRVSNLELLLQTLERQTYHNFFALVVDSGSQDNTNKMIMDKKKTEYWAERLDYIYAGDCRIGKPARSRNIGVGNLPDECGLVLFLDSDIILNRETLYDIAAAYEKNDNCIIMPQTFWMKPLSHKKIKEKIEDETYIDFFDPDSYERPYIEKGTFVGWDLRFELENNPFNETGSIKKMKGEWLLFLNVAFPRRMLKVIGPIDEDMKGYGYEDIEFGIRAENLLADVMTLNYVGGVHMWHEKDSDSYKLYVQNQANLHYVLCRYPDKKLVDIDWKIWWHYMKKRGGHIFKGHTGYWLVDKDMEHKIYIDENDLYRTDFIPSDAKDYLEDDEKLINMGCASFEYNKYVKYNYCF